MSKSKMLEEYISQEGNRIIPNSLKSVGKFVRDFVMGFVSVSIAPYIIPTVVRKVPEYWEKYDISSEDSSDQPAGHSVGGIAAFIGGYPAQILGYMEFITSNLKESEGLEKSLTVAGVFVATNILSALYETIRHNVKKK